MDTNLAFQEEMQEELIGGKIVMMSPAAVKHVLIGGNIYRVFANYLHGKQCVPIADGVLVFLTEDDHFVPDFMIVCEKDKIHSDGVYGAPDMVVEILSPSTAARDKAYKKNVYARCGVREYWIVSPGDKFVEQYLLREGTLELNNVYTLYPDYLWKHLSEEQKAAIVTEFKCSLYDDLTISLEDIFARVP